MPELPYPNIDRLLQNIKAGTPRYNFNSRIDADIVDTAEKAYGFRLSASYKRFLISFNGGMILQYDQSYFIDMLEDEPDEPIDSSFYLFPLAELLDRYRDLRLDKWQMHKHFDGIYPIIPICSTPDHETIFMVSNKGIDHESPVFATETVSGEESIFHLADTFDQFLGMYIHHNGFPPMKPDDKNKSFPDFIEANKVLETANEVLNYEDTMEQANAMIKRYPKDAWSYCERGNHQMNFGYRELALHDFNHAISLKENESFFYFCRGDLVLKYGSARKALIDLDIAVKLAPADKLYLTGRAEAFLKLAESTNGAARKAKLNKALSDCNAVLDQDFVYRSALSLRYRVYMALGEKEKAAADSAVLDDLYRN